MCCSKYWTKIIAFTLALLIGVYSAKLNQQTFISDAEKEGTDVISLTYRTTNIPLKIISVPEAKYTEAARRNKVSGVVRLRVTFLASGHVGAITPIDRLPNRLTEKAIEAALNIIAEPEIVFGVPVETTVIVEYKFSVY